MVIAFKLNGKVKGLYKSQSEASRKLKLDVGNINHVLKGLLNKTGNYTFIECKNMPTDYEIIRLSWRVKLYFTVVSKSTKNWLLDSSRCYSIEDVQRFLDEQKAILANKASEEWDCFWKNGDGIPFEQVYVMLSLCEYPKDVGLPVIGYYNDIKKRKK